MCVFVSYDVVGICLEVSVKRVGWLAVHTHQVLDGALNGGFCDSVRRRSGVGWWPVVYMQNVCNANANMKINVMTHTREKHATVSCEVWCKQQL